MSNTDSLGISILLFIRKKNILQQYCMTLHNHNKYFSLYYFALLTWGSKWRDS